MIVSFNIIIIEIIRDLIKFFESESRILRFKIRTLYKINKRLINHNYKLIYL